jgi:hypothetical protein
MKTLSSLLCFLIVLPGPASALMASQVSFFGIPVETGESGPMPLPVFDPAIDFAPSPAKPAPSKKPASADAAKPNPITPGSRIVVLFDVSRSVLNKARASDFPLKRIKEEAIRLVPSSPDGAMFNIAQFTQNHMFFESEPVSLNDSTRAEIVAWIADRWIEEGTIHPGPGVTTNRRGLVGLMEKIASMQPDTVYLISDGSFHWRIHGKVENIPWPDIARSVAGVKRGEREAELNFVGFQMKPADKAQWSRIVAGTGGVLSDIR